MDNDTSQPNLAKQQDVDKLVKNYKYYQDKLLQVSSKNRSVVLKKLYDKHNFDLTKLEDKKPGIITKIITKLLKNESTSINILLDSIDDDEADSLRKKLRSLEKNLKLVEEETGQQTGYLGFPFLQGHANQHFYLRGPLVLFPISIQYTKQAKNGGWFLNTTDKKPILNGALVAALKKIGGYSLPDNYEDTFDDLLDSFLESNSANLDRDFFNKLSEWTKSLIQIDDKKNQAITNSLTQLSSDDIEKLEKQPFHLANYKIIGNFPQADNEIFKDYYELIKRADHLNVGVIGELLEIQNHAESQSTDEDFERDLNKVSNKEFNLVLESDSSQEQVILESKHRDLVVVRGPPGTGKSQVIVNLVSDALTNNKRVLVVCQKRAALEVVHQRLGQVDLDRYIVFLAKENDDRLRMYKQLLTTIELDALPQHPGEKTVEELSAAIDQRASFLATLGAAMRKPYFDGVTAHRLYSIAKPGYKSVLNLSKIDLSALNWKNLTDYLDKIDGVEAGYKKYEEQTHPWLGRNSFAKLGMIDKNKIDDDLDKLIESLSNDLILVNSKHLQEKLVSTFSTYLNNPGFLKLNRKKAGREIEEMLKINKITDKFVEENTLKVQRGFDFWNQFTEFIKIFENSQRKITLEKLVIDSNFKSILESLKDSLRDFDSIVEYDKKKEEFDQLISQILAECKQKMNPNDNWTQSIEQEIYAYWIDYIEKDNHVLSGNPIENYEKNRKELEVLLDTKKRTVIKKIQREIEDTIRMEDIYRRNRTSEQQEWKQLMTELKRKRKVLPIRKLFETYGHLLFKIAPCWLASPEVISKVFPLRSNLFDLVIVDEASQLAIERSIPFLYRAKHAVVAGDEKQLPPFDLFQIQEDDPVESDGIVSDEKSLLDLARTKYKTINLSWHYRSDYQDLINFSNHAFYEGLLNIVPNHSNDPNHPPIRWISCNGVWSDNKNHVEARQVIEEIKNIWQAHEKSGKYPSIGVITFNDQQKTLIEDQLDKVKEVNPEFYQLFVSAHLGKKKDDELFVKNIENVQGDERDIIIFSIGYANDPDGKFSNHFGTLSMKGGENRLNVAITRARKEMVIISSIDASMVKETSLNEGPRRLRQFLEYAKAVNSLNKDSQKAILNQINPEMERSRNQRRLEFDSEFEIQVHTKLEQKGYKVDTHVGFSGYTIDLAIIHPSDPNRYVLGIECDGAMFHSAKSVKERDVARQKFLEGKGWKISRIWSRNWWKNPEQELEKITNKVDELKLESVKSNVKSELKINNLETSIFKSGPITESSEPNIIKLEEKNTLDVSNFVEKGMALFKSGKYDEAITFYDKALQLDANNISGLNNKATALDKLGRHIDALECINNALEIDANNTNTLNNKAATLFQLGNYRGSIELCDKILEIDPTNPTALSNKKIITQKIGAF